MRRRASAALALSRAVAPLSRRQVLLAVGSGAVASASSIGLMATSAWLITRASERPPVLALSIAMGAVQAFALGRGVSRYAQRLAIHGAALHALTRLRLWLFDVLEPLVPSGLNRRGSGSVVSGFVEDVEIVTASLAKQWTAVIDVCAAVLIGASVAALVLPGAGTLVLLCATAMIVIAVGLARVSQPGADRAASTRTLLAGAAYDSVRSARELVVYGRRDLVEDQLTALHRAAAAASTRQAAVTGLARGVAIAAAATGLVGVLLAAVAAHNNGQLSGVMLAVVVLVTLVVLDEVGTLPLALSDGNAGDAAARRLGELAALQPLAHEPAVDRSPRTPDATAMLHRASVSAPHAAPGTALLLHDVTLRVGDGQRVALVGRSGSGKTSVLHTLLHFLEPCGGSATLGGVDVRDMSRAGIARQIAWLPEITHIFDASLADNLRVARGSATTPECAQALTQVGLGPWYASLPDGLATRLGASGRAVSAGERQRLGIARTLLSDAGTLLLDEPSTHLDPESAMDVLATVLAAAGSRSALVVSHEPAVTAVVHDVVTLSEGRVAEATLAPVVIGEPRPSCPVKG